MGLTLAKAVEWTSAGGSGGKLEYTPMNKKILEAIVAHMEGYSGRNPEIAQLDFNKSLEWKTNLDPSKFSGGYQTSDSGIASDKQTKDGQPLLSLKKDGNDYIICVNSLEMLDTIMGLAGDLKLAETRACVEENSDPVAQMLGDRFATVEGTDDVYYTEAERLFKSPRPEEGDEDDNKKFIFKAALDFHYLDITMMRDILTTISENVRVTPSAVEAEYELLQGYSGPKSDKLPLKHIQPTEMFRLIHQNGCRSPPWRQLHGDIAYFLVQPHDVEELSVTASTNGWFINQGYNKETKELLFDIEGEIYHNLVAILKEKSPQFAEFMSNQQFRGTGKEATHTSYTREETDLSRPGQRGAADRADKSDGKKAGGKDDEKRERKPKELEPSLKWKQLGVTAEKNKEHAKEKKSEKHSAKTQRPQRRIHTGHGEHGDDSFSESESESEEEEEETPERRNESNADLPSEYWQINKLVKYLKGGNQTSTIISLCALRDFQLNTEVCQLAIRDVGGLEVLLNLLDTEELRCKIGALKILKEISSNPQIRKSIADLGGLQTMVRILRDPNKELKCLSAETIANVARFKRARRTVRQHGGIRKLVSLLDCPAKYLTPSKDSAQIAPNDNEAIRRDKLEKLEREREVEMARCGALALWSCSSSTKNKQAMKKAGVIPLLARLLKSQHENMLIPVVGTLQECASEDSYRIAIRTEGMIKDLVKNLKSKDPELQMHCASTIFKCAEEKNTRDLVREFDGLKPLVLLLEKQDNKELLAAATGAIWKCAISDENVQIFQGLKSIERLVGLLNNQPEEVLVNVVGALGEMAKNSPNREAIRKAGGISHLVKLLTSTNQALLVNVTRSVGQCAEEPENMAIIDKMDGVRLLWSLLKNPNPEVQAHAATAIGPCIDNVKDAGEMVRSFVGGLELIVSLLKSEHQEVLAAVCAAIASIAKDEENLAVITDHGVVPLLAHLTNTTDDRLRCHLAEAIARCCSWGSNRVDFGKQGAVAPLVNYLKSQDAAVHRSTARALFQLSKNPDNCITMHESGVVKPLLGMVGSPDSVLQEAAAGCISNIRRLAMANEKSRQSKNGKDKK